jgi:hypothetical protein
MEWKRIGNTPLPCWCGRASAIQGVYKEVIALTFASAVYNIEPGCVSPRFRGLLVVAHCKRTVTSCSLWTEDFVETSTDAQCDVPAEIDGDCAMVRDSALLAAPGAVPIIGGMNASSMGNICSCA